MAGRDLGSAPCRAWARLLGLDRLQRFAVVVNDESPLCRPGWIGILGLDGTVTVTVPEPGLQAPIAAALEGLDPAEATTPTTVRTRLPTVGEIRGPFPLFYPSASTDPAGPEDAVVIASEEVGALASAVAPDELHESGVDEVTSPIFGSRTATGELAAVCGYRRWANDVAHMSVLAHPDHRRLGHARRAAVASIHHACDADLLPQWRARPVASRALARSLGLLEYGAQVNIAPA